MRKGILALVIATIASLLLAASASAQAPAPKVLVFHGTPDATVTAGLAAIEALGTDNGFDVDDTANAGDFTANNLAQYRAIVFLGNSGDALSTAQETALQAYIQNGGGFVGIGGAAEAEPGSTFFGNLIGARPATASPTGTSEQIVAVGDRVHPATKGLPLEWRRTDVWYQWQQRPTGQVHTVARYHAPNAPAGDGTNVGGTDWPISWCRDFQGGRSFYTGMGRTAGSFSEADFRTHLLGAIQWSSGMLRAGCKATIAANYTGERLVNGASGDLTHTGEAHGVSTAPNGWTIYIGRADCRTNAQRGAMIGAGPTGRILDFANRNVGVGCGDVHIFDPEEYDGTVNSGDTLAGILPVYGDRGGGSEINGKIEAGLLGVAVAPDFATTGHIYLQYFPTFNPDNPVHPGLADGDARRITKMQHARVSRFTIDLETKQLELDSEVVIFQYDSQIYSCCHRGGGMGFDSEGNLYVTTGDSNSSQSTNGYSGNYQPARCPTGDPNTASNNHCGSNNISYNDARRTAGSTNDYNGKMLRLNPIDTIPDGAQPTVGVGTTYTLPTPQSPNGPNLFDGTEGGGGKAKPEIYAMGLRNPSRLFIDPQTDIPYSAWVGPDAGSPSATQGPSTYESATQLASAGNYGWPYCMGNQQPYRDRIADGSLRTTNVAGYVNGGPASAPTPGWYDCDNLVNDSTNNTGLTVLPHVTGTGKDAGTARSLNLWYSRGNPGGTNGCPDFPRELGADNGPNYGATPTQLCPYLTASGATVFNGPVYRFDDDAEDNSVRWPEYWDGRWFLQDFSNNSAKHALLLDPATDQDGGKPVYADSFRGVLNWQNNYMDSKFGPDGALYVQVYDGFFTTGPGAGLYRFSYTGGPDTPNPDPQWSTTSTERQIRFSLGRSGGVSYEWDFGDGSPTSSELSPTHTYAAAGTYTAELTVTYADGEELSRTVEVLVGDDSAAPATTAETAGTGPVEVTLSATDGAGGTGVEWTEYRIDGGAFTRHDNTEDDDPFVTTLTVSGAGTHTVQFRSRDRAGNVEDPLKELTVAIEEPGGGGGESCLPQSDEFDGSALDSKWTVLRQAGGGPVVANGSIGLPILQGDFIANDPLASNTLLQDAPSGEWTVTARLNTTELNANGEQAGLVIWKSESPNTFSKIVAIQSNGGNKQFEHIVTQNGGVNPPIPNSITPAPGGQMPEHVLLRARYDGTKVIGEFSPDDGESWTLIGQEGHAAPFTAPLRVGLATFRGNNGGGTATFDWFRIHEGSEPGGPVECAGGQCNPLSDQFSGAALDSKWELVNPNETTPPAVADGHLTLPLVPGDLYGGNGNAQMILQQAPAGSWVATAKIAHANVDTNGEAAGLALVNSFNPNHFVKTGVQYKSDTDPNTPGDQPGKWAERVLTSDGNAITIPPETVPWPNSGALNLTGAYVYVRFVHDAAANTITTWTSTNGTTFTQFGQPMSVTQYLNQPGGLKVGLFGKHDGSGDDMVDVDAFNVVAGTADPQTPGDDCGAAEQCPQNDEFDGAALDGKWEVINPNPDALSVGGGNLTLTSAVGDVRNAAFSAQNILLQAVPEGPWTATMKFDHTALSLNGQAAGMVLYGQQNPNYFAKVATQYKDNDLSGNPMNGIWIERTLTSNGASNTNYGGAFPNTGKLEPPTDDLWIRTSYDGTNVITEYSLDGEAWAAIAPPVPADQYGTNGVTKIGLFVKHDNGGTPADVEFDSFRVEAASCGEQSDTTPPRTTHELDPAEPDGDNDWYTSPVEVTLNATDNEGGSGVDFTEYRFAGDEEWTRYSGPITVDDEGRHTLQYRSTDEEGNVETTRSVTFQIDPNAPTTTAKLDGEAPASNYDGPVDVDLDATDGDGSGVRTTEIRVDGGEWKPYVEEETILNSAADLEKWAQTGPGGLNWMDQDGGFARTFSGFGMPWYPVKDYGDFSLKLQWRDSSTGAAGNSGVFVRFPDPLEAVQRPAAERHSCQVGSAQSDPAWVAIYCGHEIQINDAQTSEPQKTGSIYNFSPNNATQAQVQPKGTWVDYEVRVVGQHYTITRNGTVIKEFQNSPDQQSSRAGDPPTNARQFARGFIGLQNHGSSDVIDFRNIRILPLDEGSVRGPVTVEGDGAHTVEYRSTDAAGNQEAVKKVDFTIGGADETAPVTTHALDPAAPGAGGTYSGPVDVTLSSSDPAEGGAEPVAHDVDANGFSWDPSSFNATTGDTVRWNFPEDTAAFPHDVFVIRPGEAPNSEGHRIAETTQPGGPSASTTVDAAGDWIYYCSLHSSVQQGQWTGMVGTVHVAQGSGGSEGSGVDFTEYRVNTDGATGDWVRSDNTGDDDPFETAFTVEDEGSHVVQYRSTDNAGNEEAVKSVAFSIEAADPDAPQVEGFADPQTGAAPLRVQFSATGLDPQGGELLYEWDFGDGSGSFNQSPEHVYTKAGTYTATVTGTDPQGKTGTATVTIEVTATGNQAPVVRATADPKTGQAPLVVAFSAQATDPDGPASQITYLWDFDDNGANAFGRNASHTYTRPGTYHATVTATDRLGAFDKEEVVITVEDPPGNVAPIVTAAATPRSGTAPLRVSFTSFAVDPDGDQVSTVWDFGDGVKAGGANIAHTYTQAGTYTATVTVKDPGGLTDTDSVVITVASTTGSQGSPPPPSGGVQGESAERPRVRAPKRKGVRSIIKRGLRLRVTCNEACRARSVLRVSGERLGASKRLRLRAGQSRRLVVRLDRSVRRNLVAAMRQAGIKRLKAFAVTKIATADGTRKVRVKVVLKR
jgi:PKD repeat protein/plastocyanin/type 1 glutamine amidotransferase